MANVRYTKDGAIDYTERRNITATAAYRLGVELLTEANPDLPPVSVSSRTLSVAASGGDWDEPGVRVRITVTDDELDTMTDMADAIFPRRLKAERP